MIVNSDLLSGLNTTFRAIFEESFAAAAGQQIFLNGLAMRVPSDTENETYSWFGTVPQMQDVTHGTVDLQGLNKYSFTVTNREYQNAIEVERVVIERDKLGQVRPRLNQLAMEAARHPAQLLMDLFETPGNAFDGTAFFANTRVIGSSANIDNILAGTGVTVAQFQADLAVARGTMRDFQDDQGRPMNLIGNVLVIPSELEQTVWQALNVSQGDGVISPTMPADFGNGTQMRGYNVFVNPYLTDADDWYLLHAMGDEERPFVFQEEKPVEFLGADDTNTRNFITARSFVYSAYGRYAVGVTDPRFAVKTTN
jgi:phage major head subunit gpT-like protein